MINLIKKIFIKNYNQTENEKVRLKYGLVAGIFGIISNLILFIAKILVGIVGASITIIADAINNLSDMGSSIIVLLGFKLSSKPADSEHPFGHERYEQIMALIVAVIVFSIGVLLGKSSIEKIISPETTTVSLVTYIILVIAILVKLLQMFVYKDFAKSINSEILKASSYDSRNDVISTSVVLIATLLIDLFANINFSIDGVFGVLVSLFIIISSVKLIKETIDPLLGAKPDDEFVEGLKAKILSYDGVLGVHDFLIHSYGVNTYFASVHVEVSSKVDIMISHDIIDNIERDFKENLNIILSIHLDPIENDNEEVVFHKQKVVDILQKLDITISIHDFRMVKGESHTNLLFDIVLPFSSKLNKKDIIDTLQNGYKDEEKKYFFVIEIDRA